LNQNAEGAAQMFRVRERLSENEVLAILVVVVNHRSLPDTKNLENEGPGAPQGNSLPSFARPVFCS
jgi:hypothetical protein